MAVFQLPEWAALAPALILAGTALVLFLFDSINPRSTNRSLLAGTAVAGSLASLAVAVWFTAAGVGATGIENYGVVDVMNGQFIVDRLALYFMIIISIVTALVAVASYDYLRDHTYQAEYYSLVVLAATGMSMIAASNSLVTIFIALELTSLPSYALVAILKDNRGSVEAGLKYFLIGALSSAIFVYGISLVYGATGSLQLEAVAANLGAAGEMGGLLGLGILMLIGGVAFKTASVPFHFWAPEAYEGAPAPISAFLSSASKAAGFVLAFRVFTTAFPLEATTAVINVDWTWIFVVLAIVTMTLGNFAAATQEHVKRMLAYSSIGHAGYVLIGLAALSTEAGDLVMGAAMMHLLVYGFMNTGAFLFVALAEYWGVGPTFEDYNGLSKQAPFASAAMAVFMFSLAGVPPFGGFWSKYLLYTETVNAAADNTVLLVLAAALVVNSALSLYYYSRLVKALWIEEPILDRDRLAQPTGLYAAIIAAAVMTVVILPAFDPIATAALEAAAAVVG